jgi:CBS domain-containing protein
VVDHDGRLIGSITRRDLLRVFLRPDGDIHLEITASVLRATFNLPPTPSGSRSTTGWLP